MVMVTPFWDCTLPPLVEIREHPEFHGLMEMDKSRWPTCLLWHGWLPLFSGVNGGSPWAENLPEGAGNLLECALGSYTSGLLTEWQLPVEFDATGAASRVPDEPHVWMGAWFRIRSRVPVLLGLVFFTHLPGRLFSLDGDGAIWMMMLVKAGSIGLAVVTALFLVFLRLFREWIFGCYSSSAGLPMVLSLVLTICVLCVMSVACWMAILVPVLLSM